MPAPAGATRLHSSKRSHFVRNLAPPHRMMAAIGDATPPHRSHPANDDLTLWTRTLSMMRATRDSRATPRAGIELTSVARV